MVEEYVDGSHRFVQRFTTTSGTSGHPFQIFQPVSYAEKMGYIEFESFRFLLWDKKYTNPISKTKIAIIRRKLYSTPLRLGLNYAHFRDNPKRIFLELAEFKPDVLMAWPSVLFDIAQMIQNDKTLPSLIPRYILSTGELLTPAMRSFLSEQFDSEIYNRYALGEFDVVGTECDQHNGFHINSESVIVEITDNAGHPFPEGEPGKIVVTSLINYNMPFIRYDTGDRGFLSHKRCSCGLYTPRLWLEGRQSVSLTFGNRQIYRYEFVDLDLLMHEVFQYQAVKRSETELLIRVVPGPAWKETTKMKVKEGAEHFLDTTSIQVSVEIVPNIPKAPSGKLNLLVDESPTRRDSSS
ncbi:MAG: AMP-binding protein [Candidatus Paceibacterota bacterium]|jgi:phenylacetate-CoA ligase